MTRAQCKCMGRDLDALRRATRPDVDAARGRRRRRRVVDERWHRDGLTAWDFDSLPAEVSVVRGGIQIATYPTLIDRGDSVDLRLLDTPAQSERLTRRGVARLYALAQRKSIRIATSLVASMGRSLCVGVARVELATR